MRIWKKFSNQMVAQLVFHGRVFIQKVLINFLHNDVSQGFNGIHLIVSLLYHLFHKIEELLENTQKCSMEL